MHAFGMDNFTVRQSIYIYLIHIKLVDLRAECKTCDTKSLMFCKNIVSGVA